ncbi:hypothetical protein AB0L42_26690 [Streptomyces sp. NPDC052287]|uniref:hypothetical protein n=1 Tax=Streptomyces sp. NPDC052287 TaxID=3154950 RepID=UPI0034475B30
MTQNANTAALPIPFAPAFPDDVKAEKGTGYLTPGGLVVHTGWSRPLEAAPHIRRQHRAYEGYGTQCWNISTPDGRIAARFPCLTLPDAEAAAARIAAALPGGVWPADADTRKLLPLALEASSTPDMLPLRHRDKPNWGTGLGSDMVDFHLPDTRADYEKMIAAHGRIPKTCRACARTVREQKKLGWGPRTNHWPKWSVTGHRGAYTRAHCYCAVCMGLDLRIGAFGPATDDDGDTVPGSAAVSPWSDPRVVVQGSVDLDRSDRPFAWFAFFLEEAGHVVVDDRKCVNLWPVGVRHDDALFCETGITGTFNLEG